MGEHEDRLKTMDENWQTQKEEGFGVFPDGKYKFQLQAAEIVESMSSNRLQIHREHLCLEGEQAGNVLHDYLQLETEWGPKFTMQWIEQMGREIPDNASGLEEVVAEIAEAAPIYEGNVKSKDGFTNIRITKLIQGQAELEGADGSGEHDCQDFGNYEEGHETCSKCGDAEACKAATGGGETESDDQETGSEETGASEEHACADFGQYDAEDTGCQGCDDSAACKAASEGGEEEEKNEALDELVAFCQAQDIAVTDDDDVDSLTTKVKEYSWDKKQLIVDEGEMLERIGATFEEPTLPPKKTGKAGKSGKSSKGGSSKKGGKTGSKKKAGGKSGSKGKAGKTKKGGTKKKKK